jgi:hypothetical protein
MNIFIAIKDIRDPHAAVLLTRWPEKAPLVLPCVGDSTKKHPGPYGKVIRRSFNYEDGGDLTVELLVEYQ